MMNLPILKFKYKSFTDLDTTSTSYIDGGIVPLLENVDSLGQTRLIEVYSNYVFNFINETIQLFNKEFIVSFIDSPFGFFNIIDSHNLYIKNFNQRIKLGQSLFSSELKNIIQVFPKDDEEVLATLSNIPSDKVKKSKLVLCDVCEKEIGFDIDLENLEVCFRTIKEGDISIFSVSESNLSLFRNYFSLNNLFINGIFFLNTTVNNRNFFNTHTSDQNIENPFKNGIYFIIASTKSETSEYFVELNLDKEIKPIISEYFNKLESDKLVYGEWVDIGNYKGDKNLKAKNFIKEYSRQIEKISVEYNSNPKFTLADLVKETKIQQVTKEFIEVNQGENILFLELETNQVTPPTFYTSLKKVDQLKIDKKYLSLKLNETLILRDFLLNFFRTNIGVKIIESISFNYFNAEDILSIWLFLPSISQQEKILFSLDRINELKKVTKDINYDLIFNPLTFDDADKKISNMLDSIGQLNDSELIKRLIYEGESKTLEFKQTFSVNVKDNTKQKFIEDASIKTIGAFLNSDGGILLIGVSDFGELTGMENEINLFYKSLDQFLLHFKNVLRSRIGEQYYPFISYRIIDISGKLIVYVKCKQSKSEVYIDGKDFYVRTNPATDKLEGPKLVSYIKHHFNF